MIEDRTLPGDPTPAWYDERYYLGGGHSNYQGYIPQYEPEWAWRTTKLLRNCPDPILDLGAAYGHLVACIQRSGRTALALEWSAFASARAVCADMIRGDGRELPIRSGTIGTVVGLDFIEHVPEADTSATLREIKRVLRPHGGLYLLVGWHEPDAPGDNHFGDRTHVNHNEPLWYAEALTANGFVLDPHETDRMRRGSRGDWQRRWLVAHSPL